MSYTPGQHQRHLDRSSSKRSIYHNRTFSDSNNYTSKGSGSNPLLDSENKFNVSLIAATTCRYISWNRSTLEYFLAKDCYMANVLSLIMARDITNKLYAMNDKVCRFSRQILSPLVVVDNFEQRLTAGHSSTGDHYLVDQTTDPS